MAAFTEAILDQMESILSLGLSTKLDALDTEYDDGIVLEDPILYFKGRKFQVSQTPAVILWPDSAPGDEYASEDSLKLEYRIISYIVISSETDAEKMWIRIFRYLRGMTEVIRATHNLEGAVDICKFGGFIFESPWLAVRENTYIAIAGVVWNISDEEIL